MSEEEQKVVEEEPKPEILEEPKKITVPPKKKEKDPKKVAQGKRLSQISEKCKKKKMRREIEKESKLFEFSVSYNTLSYLGVSAVVFAGMYLYFSNKKQQPENLVKFSPVRKHRSPEKTKNNEQQPARKQHVSLFD